MIKFVNGIKNRKRYRTLIDCSLCNKNHTSCFSFVWSSYDVLQLNNIIKCGDGEYHDDYMMYGSAP